MTFCTVINCMDGRVQQPVLDYLRRRFQVPYVDTITEAGPIKHLADGLDEGTSRRILDRLEISRSRHGSRLLAIVGHHDCAGNPVPQQAQYEQLARAGALLRRRFPDMEVIALWVDEQWRVRELTPEEA